MGGGSAAGGGGGALSSPGRARTHGGGAAGGRPRPPWGRLGNRRPSGDLVIPSDPLGLSAAGRAHALLERERRLSRRRFLASSAAALGPPNSASAESEAAEAPPLSRTRPAKLSIKG